MFYSQYVQSQIEKTEVDNRKSNRPDKSQLDNVINMSIRYSPPLSRQTSTSRAVADHDRQARLKVAARPLITILLTITGSQCFHWGGQTCMPIM